MRVYIPATYRAALLMMRRTSADDIRRYDEIEAAHKAIALDLFARIMGGEISEAHQYFRQGRGLILYTRSTRGEFIQETTLHRSADGSWNPISHRDITDADGISFQPGKHLTMTA